MKNTKDFVKVYEENSGPSKDELAVDYLPVVKAMSYRLKERLPSSIEASDLISIGAEELIKLAKRYDPSLNDSFWGYAKKRVYGAMLDFLRSLDTVSRNDRRLIKAVEKAIAFYYSDHNEEPTDEWLAQYLKEDLEKVSRARSSGDTYSLMSMNEQLKIFGDENTQETVEQEELLDIVRRILGKMDERDQTIIQLYFFEELSLKEISQILNITESRISQIIKSVTRKIREQVI